MNVLHAACDLFTLVIIFAHIPLIMIHRMHFTTALSIGIFHTFEYYIPFARPVCLSGLSVLKLLLQVFYDVRHLPALSCRR